MRRPRNLVRTIYQNSFCRAALTCAAALFVFVLFMGPSRIIESVFPKYAFNEITKDEPLESIPMKEDAPLPEASEVPEETLVSGDNLIITYKNIFSLKSFDIVKKNLYNIDRTAYVYDDELDFEKLLSMETRVDLYGGAPKVLIFHTHSSEDFIDSREGMEEDTIIGVGDVLEKILTEKYGVSVLHHKGVYDMVDGKIMRGGSYEAMEKGVRKVLEENPSIEVMIDLHRDSLPNNKRLLTDINGRQTAQIMYFNGVCRLDENGTPVPTEGLTNEFIEENLALSLKMKLLTNEMFPDFSRKNYIKPYRYSLHMRPNSLLIEVGSDTNTVSEVKNAMEPLAEVLVRAFS